MIIFYLVHYSINMSKQSKEEEIFEFKIEFVEKGTDFLSERHFTAANAELAQQMLSFSCRKDGVEAEIKKTEVWNRWANRWEPAEEYAELNNQLTD